MPRSPLEVLPEGLAACVADSAYWFVIGGQAVRCFVPYRPSQDADFGVPRARSLQSLVAELRARGTVEIIETSKDTVHLNFEGCDVSIFVLPQLQPHVQGNVLTVTGILATKVHAILERGTRRDFFDLYVMLHTQGLGLLECLNALGAVYATHVNQGLVLRALTYFGDAESEAPLPGEGPDDWARVQSFFARAVAALVVPPTAELDIQSRVVDVRSPKRPQRPRQPRLKPLSLPPLPMSHRANIFPQGRR